MKLLFTGDWHLTSKRPENRIDDYWETCKRKIIFILQYAKDNNIEFENIDLSKDQKALEEIIQKTGKLEVPVVDIDGQIINGFDKKEICKLLKIRT